MTKRNKTAPIEHVLENACDEVRMTVWNDVGADPWEENHVDVEADFRFITHSGQRVPKPVRDAIRARWDEFDGEVLRLPYVKAPIERYVVVVEHGAVAARECHAPVSILPVPKDPEWKVSWHNASAAVVHGICDYPGETGEHA